MKSGKGFTEIEISEKNGTKRNKYQCLKNLRDYLVHSHVLLVRKLKSIEEMTGMDNFWVGKETPVLFPEGRVNWIIRF